MSSSISLPSGVEQQAGIAHACALAPARCTIAEASASLITGEPTTPMAEHNNFAHARALFYVVQARAGNCAPPPAKDGVPEGVS